MSRNENYQLGLLYLVHLLVSSDGEISVNEEKYLKELKSKEGIADEVFNNFNTSLGARKEREIYQEGIEYLNKCTDEEKLKAFVHLYKMSEADGSVHVKEVRLLLYSIKLTGVEFNDVVEQAKKN